MKKKLITTILLSFISSSVIAACPDGFYNDNGNCLSKGYDSYSGGSNQVINEFYKNKEDILGNSDLIFAIEAVVCNGSDKSFNEIMNDAYKVTNNYGTAMDQDSTAYGSYQTAMVTIVKYIIKNSSGRYCQKPVDFDGIENVKHFCEVSSPVTLNIDPDAIVQSPSGSIPADGSCSVLLEKSLKVNEEIILDNQTEQTFGFATVTCAFKDDGSGHKVPKLEVLKNNDSCDASSRNWDNLEDTPPSVVTCNQLCFWGEGLHCKASPYIKNLATQDCFKTNISTTFINEPPVNYKLSNGAEITMSCQLGKWTSLTNNYIELTNKLDYLNKNVCKSSN